MSETTIKPPARIEPLPLRVPDPPAPAPAPTPVLPATEDREFRLSMLRIGAQLSALLVTKNKLPEELAKDFGISSETIEGILLGQARGLSVAQLQAIAKVFVVKLLVGFEMPPSPSAK
jgi:hypothetical protein